MPTASLFETTDSDTTNEPEIELTVLARDIAAVQPRLETVTARVTHLEQDLAELIGDVQAETNRAHDRCGNIEDAIEELFSQLGALENLITTIHSSTTYNFTFPGPGSH